jgi:hypothetical protein
VTRSSELLQDALASWAQLYGKRIGEKEAEVWARIFIKTPANILARALEYVTENAERMPAPGHLTKAIMLVKEKFPELVPKSVLTHTVGKDAKGIPCIFWSDDPLTPAYSAKNCPEGRSFLILLSEISPGKSIAKP